MKRKFLISFCFFWIAFWMGILSPAYSREVRDASLEKQVISDHPLRIITLAPSLGELAADLLGPEMGRIVGVTEYTDYPAALNQVNHVGSYVHLNIEKIFSLKPDLVLGTLDGNRKEEILHLKELKIPVVLVKTGSFLEIQESIECIATALDKVEVGKRLQLKLKQGLSQFRQRAKTRPNKKILFQVGDDPLIVVGKKSFLSESIELIGASNVYGDSGLDSNLDISSNHYPRPSLEDVVHRNPDFIVVAALGSSLAPYEQMVKKWRQFPQVNAVKNGKVILFKSDSLLRPTVRILDGLAKLEEIIYDQN